ncbi:MAG: tetratricopeptide repeat protein, partial [Pirellulaceae bacterium]
IKLSPARLGAIQIDQRLNEDLAFAYWGGPKHYLNQRHVFLGGFLTGPEGLKKISAGAPRLSDNRPVLEYMQKVDLSERGFHKPIVELIQANLAPASSILTEKLPESIVQAGNTVRDENLRSIVSAAHLEIGSHLLSVGDPLGAQAHLLRAVNYLPAYAEASYFLGDAHAAVRNLPLSISFYQQAINIRPDYIRAHTHLAFILRQLGEVEGAVQHFEHVINKNPLNIHALIGLSQIRSTHPDAAVRNATEALKLAEDAFRYTQGTNPQVLMALGDAFASNGQFDKAIQAAEAAVRIMGGGLQAEGIRQRLAFYRQKRPYIEQIAAPPGQNPLAPQQGPVNPAPNQSNPGSPAPAKGP